MFKNFKSLREEEYVKNLRDAEEMEFLRYKQKYASAHEFLNQINLPKADEVLTELEKKFLDYG